METPHDPLAGWERWYFGASDAPAEPAGTMDLDVLPCPDCACRNGVTVHATHVAARSFQELAAA